MDLSIGSEFTHKNLRYKVVKTSISGCFGCALKEHNNCIDLLRCEAKDRKDGENVYAKLMKEATIVTTSAEGLKKELAEVEESLLTSQGDLFDMLLRKRDLLTLKIKTATDKLIKRRVAIPLKDTTTGHGASKSLKNS